jgi:Flp pilus assembly protein TadG
MKFKFKLLSVLLVIVAFAVQSYGQIGSVQSSVVSASTSGAYAAITNNTTAYPTNAVIELGKATSVAIAFNSELSGAGTTANTVVLQQSVDRSHWITHTSFTVTPAGTTEATVVTNLSVGGLPFLRVYSIANANANTGYITNYTVKWSAK